MTPIGTVWAGGAVVALVLLLCCAAHMDATGEIHDSADRTAVLVAAAILAALWPLAFAVCATKVLWRWLVRAVGIFTAPERSFGE